MAGVGVARAVWIPSAVGLLGSIAFFAAQPYKLEDPGKMQEYAGSDRSFTLKRPVNWKPKTLSMLGVKGEVRFEPSKDVVFTLSTDLAGSLMSDIMRSGDAQADALNSALAEMSKQNPNMAPGGGMRQPGPNRDQPGASVGQTNPNMAPQNPGGGQDSDFAKQLEKLAAAGSNGQPGKRKSPLERLHEVNTFSTVAKLPDYKESPAVKTTLGGLEAMESEISFKGSGLWGPRPVTGKRLTALGTERAIRLIYYCPKDQTTALDPVFKEMRDSIRFDATGQGPGGR